MWKIPLRYLEKKIQHEERGRRGCGISINWTRSGATGSHLVQQICPCFGQRVSPFLSKLFCVSVRTHLNEALTLFPGTLSPLRKDFILLRVVSQLLYVSCLSFTWRNEGFPYFPHPSSHPPRETSVAWGSLLALPRASPRSAQRCCLLVLPQHHPKNISVPHVCEESKDGFAQEQPVRMSRQAFLNLAAPCSLSAGSWLPCWI